MVTARNLNLRHRDRVGFVHIRLCTGSEHALAYTDVRLQWCTPGIYVMLLISVTSVHLTSKHGHAGGLGFSVQTWGSTVQPITAVARGVGLDGEKQTPQRWEAQSWAHDSTSAMPVSAVFSETFLAFQQGPNIVSHSQHFRLVVRPRPSRDPLL